MKTSAFARARLGAPMTALLDHSMAKRHGRQGGTPPVDSERVLKAARIFVGDVGGPLTEEEAEVLSQQQAELPQPTDAQIDELAKRLARRKPR